MVTGIRVWLSLFTFKCLCFHLKKREFLVIQHIKTTCIGESGSKSNRKQFRKQINPGHCGHDRKGAKAKTLCNFIMVPLYYYYLCTYCQIFLKIDVMLVFSYNADDNELLPEFVHNVTNDSICQMASYIALVNDKQTCVRNINRIRKKRQYAAYF